MYIHTKVKPLKCSEVNGGCGKGFSQARSLAIHKILNSENHNHKCPICKLSFGQRSNLKSHLLSHTEVKPKQLLEFSEKLGCRLLCGQTKQERSLSLDDDVVEPRIDAGGYEDIAETSLEGETQSLETVKRAFRGFLIDQLMAK